MNDKKLQEETKKIIGKGRKALRLGVNIFVYTFVGIFMLLMIFFGISQTSLFKDWLRDTVVEIVNNEINGRISISEIDGTIFTSLFIKDVTLTSIQKDTVFSAGNIELRTSPLKILFKNIYVRKFEIKDAKINLVEESDGQINLLKIFPSSDEPEDTTTSSFPFTIEVADFKLTNVDFLMQRYDKVGSNEYYSTLTTEDFRIKDLNISLNAFADLNKYTYRLTVDNISFSPNFKIFQLEHFSGNFLITPQLAGINKLHLVTNESEVELNAAISGIDFLNDFSIEKLSNAQMRLSLNASTLNFDDIATYVPQMKMLNGTIAANLEVSGTFNNLDIKGLNVSYNKTSLKAKANLKNLLDADKMFFDLSFYDSYLDPTDPNLLLREIEIPEYKELGVVKFDTLNYKGGTLDFETNFAINTDKGYLNGNAFIDLRPKEMIYRATLYTRNLDMGSFISIPTDINSEIKISGVGFEPTQMKLDLLMNANSSRFGEKYFNNLNVSTIAENGIIKTTLNLESDSTNANLLANIDFNNPDDPSYEIKGGMVGINLASLLNKPSLKSEFNLSLEASGQGFNPDSMDLFLVTDIRNSKFADFDIDSTRLIMDIRRNDNGLKIINVISDIADLTISGNFLITGLGNVFVREAEIIQATLSQKIDPVFFPDSSNIISDIVRVDEQIVPVNDFSLNYLLDFKESMNINFGQNQVELDGQIDGFMKSVDDSLTISLNTNFDYLKFWNDEDIYFLVNSNLNGSLSNHLINGYKGEIISSINLSCDRLYANGNIHNISSNISLNKNDLYLSLSGEYENNIIANLEAKASISENKLLLNIEEFDLKYNNFSIKNKNNILLSFHDEAINFDEFNLDVADGLLNISGSVGLRGYHEAIITLDSLSGKRAVNDILGLIGSNGSEGFQSDIKLKGLLNGNLTDPDFSITASANNLKYGNSNFGSLLSVFKFENNSLNTDIRILDSTFNYDSPSLLVTGFIPLVLTPEIDSLEKSERFIDLSVEADEFDLSSLKDVLPYLEFQNGKLETEMILSGTLTSPIAIGYFSVYDARFKVTNNNLDYDFNTKVWIDDEEITIESIELKNVFGTKNGGAIVGSGFLRLDEFKPDSTFIKLSGDLKVLDKISKSASPIVYGDLALQTRGEIVYSASRDNSYLTLPINVTVADLVVPLGTSAYSSSSGFIYKFADHFTDKDKLSYELDSLIQSKTIKDSIENVDKGTSQFNYTIDIKLDTEAEVVVVLSKELDQNLLAIMDGDFFLQSINGKKKSGGELKLLDGSNLSFIKRFDAAGNIRFDKIDNPIIDITSTYKDYYYPANGSNGQTEQEVAVKIKLKGPLSELNKNFIKDENNIGVYMGRQAIEEDKKDQSKTATDAMFFIIQGKFPNDDNVTQQDKNLVYSTATSLAGSIIGSVLNQYFDDYVKGFQLRQTNTDTRFNLIGKVWKIRYEIGGSTEVLQDLSRANVKMEYPITEKLQLRLERKESENETSSFNNPLFFEGGIKYNFEF